ncbi:SDR family NAD(P)-dependent oxidoreductase [Novosphingobium sp. JCM 18896]|uniref:SDR family NAD(P)-dependent oxidoreductase n=1 Tax=Novosphingobium sp. JCM 18896 TaxID=2989731 RepID=UPI0022226F6D|nr:SDR family oxidoreductase [Novosphingobium sp. JCM 18896]MCW1429712.1 SDR family oxidoreductase [Novosphingobium sp. JCM 18896]
MPNAVADVSARSIAELVSLAGRRAVVTGAAWGLGKATARRLAEAGATVLIGDIDAEAAAATAAELSAAYGPRVLSVRMDASDPMSITAAADLAVAEFGGIDIWVNNAGIPSHKPLLDLTDEEFDTVQAINLRGTFVGAREAARRMIAADMPGVIVNVASLAGLRGIAPGQAAYTGSKHGVVGLTKTMALEFGPKAIRVLGIAPGVCLTEKTMHLASLDAEALKKIPIPGIGGSPVGRLGVADDVARVILFAVSDLAMFMSGSTLMVEGGVAA